GPPLAFKTVRASFPAHGSSVVGPGHGYLSRPSTNGAVFGRLAARKLRFGSLQMARSRFREGRVCHSYPSVAAGLMTFALLLAPLPSDHRGPRRHIPGITPGLGCLGHLTRPRACGKAVPAPRATPRRARGGLPRS